MKKEKMLSYARWYANRYLPSEGKMREKLIQKFAEEVHLIKEVIEIIEYEGFINDEHLIESRITMYRQAGRSDRYIQQKLLAKKFSREMITQALETSTSEWGDYEERITTIIHQKLQKGYGPHFIRNHLREYGFNDEVNTLLEALEEDFQSQKETLKKQWTTAGVDHKKIPAKLYQRGF